MQCSMAFSLMDIRGQHCTFNYSVCQNQTKNISEIDFHHILSHMFATKLQTKCFRPLSACVYQCAIVKLIQGKVKHCFPTRGVVTLGVLGIL